MDICNLNFRKLLTFVPMLNEIESARLEVPGSAALLVEVLYRFGSTATIRLSQYCEHPNGHVVSDPTMIIAVDTQTGTIEALVFQNYIVTRRRCDDGKMPMNQFFGYWLSNLLAARNAANICA